MQRNPSSRRPPVHQQRPGGKPSQVRKAPRPEPRRLAKQIRRQQGR